MTQTALHELVNRPAIVFLDTETSGTDIRRDRILQIGAIRWDSTGRSTFETLVDPGPEVVIPTEASNIHHITRETLAEANAPISVYAIDAFLQFCSGANLLIAHNANFDLGILAYECQRLDLPIPPYEFMCTRTMAYLTGAGVRRPNRGGFMMLGTKLEEVSEFFGLALEGAHDAAADIAMTELVFPHLLERAQTQGLDVLNLLMHQEWLVRKGKAQPDYVPPGGRVKVVA